MKIALDATPLILSSGGLRRYVSELSLALAREFPEDNYFLLSDQAFDLPPDAPPNLVTTRATVRGLDRKWWFWGVRKAIAGCGAQVFHGGNFEVPYLGRTPAIMTIHDLSPWRNREWHSGADRVRRRTPYLLKAGRAAMVLTVSEAVRKEAIDFFGLKPEKVRAVPLAAPVGFRPVEAQPQTSYFLFVGTLEPRKNIAGLIEAWRETAPETGAELRVIGRKRVDFDAYLTLKGLIWGGEAPENALPELYSGALALVFPSFYEGFGLPVLEAMQCGCPVITSRDPALMELTGGAAIHAGTPGELADAMRSVAVSPELRASLRAAGLARAAAFSWQKTARDTRAVYAEVAGHRP